MTEIPEREIRRILVALDASPHSLSALRAAARLAASLEAELRGLFVEEEELLRLSSLSVREVDLLSARTRPLEERHVRRHVRRQRRRARREMERTANRREVRWSFSSTRGSVGVELRSAAGEADLVMVGTRGWTPGRRPGSTVLRLLREAPAPVMILRRGTEIGRRVYAVYDGSPPARRGLAAAIQIARRGELPLVVLLAAGDEALQERRREADDALSGPGLETEMRILDAPANLPSFVRSERCGLLVIPAEAAREGFSSLEEMLASVDCPVLVTS